MTDPRDEQIERLTRENVQLRAKAEAVAGCLEKLLECADGKASVAELVAYVKGSLAVINSLTP